VNEHVDQRVLTYAIGASLALHVALLGLRAPRTHPPLSPPAPLVAHLMEEERPAAPPPVVEPRPAPQPPKVERPKPAPKPKIARPEPAPPKPSALTVAPEPAPLEVPAPAIEPAPAPAPPPQAPVASAPATPAAPDPATLIARYRHQFIGAAARYKRYPLAARDNGWEGDVVVRLEIGANGELAEMKIQRSSGHEVLDEQALEMFRLAAPQVPLPAALLGRAFAFDVRAVYSLRD
jgi:protein TonB